jgi:hypothetical protein
MLEDLIEIKPTLSKKIALIKKKLSQKEENVLKHWLEKLLKGQKEMVF